MLAQNVFRVFPRVSQFRRVVFAAIFRNNAYILRKIECVSTNEVEYMYTVIIIIDDTVFGRQERYEREA